MTVELGTTVDLGTLGSGNVLHHIRPDARLRFHVAEYVEGYGLSTHRYGICGAHGLLGDLHEGVDARAIRVRRRKVCDRCRARTLAEQVQPADTDHDADRASGDAPSAASPDGLSGSSRRPEGGGMPEQKTTTRRKAATTKKTRSAPSRARSAAPAAEKTETTTAKTESGAQIHAALLKELRSAIGQFESFEPKKKNRTRLVAPGARGAFCYVHPPSKGGVNVQIPKQLKHVKAGLPKDTPFEEKGWGLTYTLRSKDDIPAAITGLKLAAAASQPDEDQETSRSRASS